MSDLINRADAIEAIASAEPKDNEYHYYKHIAIKILSEIPSVDVIKFDFSKLSSGQLHDIHRHNAKASIEVEPTQAEKCEDCIHNDTNKDKITCKECASIEAIQGEWIKTVDGNGWNEWYVLKCPFCGASIEDKQCRSWEYNFCPNCGADMIPYKGDDNNESIPDWQKEIEEEYEWLHWDIR